MAAGGVTREINHGKFQICRDWRSIAQLYCLLRCAVFVGEHCYRFRYITAVNFDVFVFCTLKLEKYRSWREEARSGQQNLLRVDAAQS